MTSEIYVSVEESTTDVSVNLAGIQGPRGNSVLSGVGPPDVSTGIDDDFYIDTLGKAIYGPKESGAWPELPLSTFAVTNRFIFIQSTPADEWVINHSLGGRPSISIVDSAATLVIGEVVYVSDTQVIVRFTAPFSGFAYLT
jgi:hypothetical protein